MEEEITFQGHKNIVSLHARTIEITKDSYLTKNGDCIVGVSANKACKDLNTALKSRLKTKDTIVNITIVDELGCLGASQLAADPNFVDIMDFAVISEGWQESGSCKGDIDGDNVTDFYDLAILVYYWLSDCYVE